MHALGVKFNEYTFPNVVKEWASKMNIMLGEHVHGVVVVIGFERDVFVANTLIFMYAKCDQLADAKRLLENIPEKNVVGSNALISCYTQKDTFAEAMALFQEMVAGGVMHDEYSLPTILNTAIGLGDNGHGKKVHGYLIKLGYDGDPFSSNALVGMYCLFDAIIASCEFHDYHARALELLAQMIIYGL